MTNDEAALVERLRAAMDPGEPLLPDDRWDAMVRRATEAGPVSVLVGLPLGASGLIAVERLGSGAPGDAAAGDVLRRLREALSPPEGAGAAIPWDDLVASAVGDGRRPGSLGTPSAGRGAKPHPLTRRDGRRSRRWRSTAAAAAAAAAVVVGVVVARNVDPLRDGREVAEPPAAGPTSGGRVPSDTSEPSGAPRPGPAGTVSPSAGRGESPDERAAPPGTPDLPPGTVPGAATPPPATPSGGDRPLASGPADAGTTAPPVPEPAGRERPTPTTTSVAVPPPTTRTPPTPAPAAPDEAVPVSTTEPPHGPLNPVPVTTTTPGPPTTSTTIAPAPSSPGSRPGPMPVVTATLLAPAEAGRWSLHWTIADPDAVTGFVVEVTGADRQDRYRLGAGARSVEVVLTAGRNVVTVTALRLPESRSSSAQLSFEAG